MCSSDLATTEIYTLSLHDALPIRRHVNVIADDSMLGRNTPSRGLDMTANYVAAQFKRLGFKPGGESHPAITIR